MQQVDGPTRTWSVEQTAGPWKTLPYILCQYEPKHGGYPPGSVTQAVTALNKGDLVMPEGLCVVFSTSQAKNYLLYRSDKKEDAKRLVGLVEEIGNYTVGEEIEAQTAKHTNGVWKRAEITDHRGDGVFTIKWLDDDIIPTTVTTEGMRKKVAATKQDHPMLGVVMLDMKYPGAGGSNTSPASFAYDVICKVVQNFTLEMAQAGSLTPEVEKNFDDTIKLLQRQGCSAITGDSGFMMAFQKRARKVASVPVFMSAMVQCPAIACTLKPGEKILIMAASGPDLRNQKKELLETCGVDVESERYIIVGCEDTPVVTNMQQGLPTVLDEVQPIIVKKAMDSIFAHPAIRAIILNSTQLPPYADALRAVTGLPVWDCITAADFYISSFQDNHRFGLDDWQHMWQKVEKQQPGKDEGSFTSMKSPTKDQLKNVSDNLSKRQHPILGIIRMDFNFDGAAAGDVQNPASYGYDVIYKSVPGLTFAMAQKGTMPPQVEQDFRNSIKWLEGKGANCITGDCGFLMAFQKLGRQAAAVPVFMSSMVQCPIVSALFDLEEKILLLTANSDSLTPQKDILLSHCGFNVNNDQYVIVGCQDVPGFEAVLEGKVVDAALIEKGIVAKVQRAISANPKIRAILCECHGLAQWADAMRKTTGLAVFDIITNADFMISAMKDNPRFGMNDWQLPWDGTIEEYKFGQHLSEEEKGRITT